MAFCIMRMEKIKDRRGVTMALQHNTRDRQPDNADPSKAQKNAFYGGTALECGARFDGLMPEKVRKNAVLAVEMVLTASPDFGSSPKHGNWGDYLTACDMWALKTFGIDLNKKGDIRPAIHVAHHYDEKTPHTHILIVPLKDGKLNAKHFIGGSRDRMAELQQSFYEDVGQRFGLDRGRPREETRAKHTHQNLAALDNREKELVNKADELDRREKGLAAAGAEFAGRSAELDRREAAVKAAAGITPAEAAALKKEALAYMAMTPQELRGLATVVEGRGCKNVAEYRKSLAIEREQAQRHKHTPSR